MHIMESNISVIGIFTHLRFSDCWNAESGLTGTQSSSWATETNCQRCNLKALNNLQLHKKIKDHTFCKLNKTFCKTNSVFRQNADFAYLQQSSSLILSLWHSGPGGKVSSHQAYKSVLCSTENSIFCYCIYLKKETELL